jgi:hypothetical protein
MSDTLMDSPRNSNIGLEPARLGDRFGSRFGNLGQRLGGLATGTHNVGKAERWMSALGGAALAALALRNRSKGAIGLAALAGVPLLVRGATGHCAFYQALGIDRGPEAGNGGISPFRNEPTGSSVLRSAGMDNPPAPLTSTTSPGTHGLLGRDAQDDTGRDPIGQNF